MASIHKRVRQAVWGTLVLGWAAACAQVTSGVGGESHFVCRSQADCESRPGEVCFLANPASETGECVSESVLRDAVAHLGSGGAGGRGGQGGTDGGGTTTTPPGGPYCGASQQATYPEAPTGVQPSTRNVEIVAAQYVIDLGDGEPNPSQPPKHYLEVGFDLDNKCTVASDPKQGTCRAPSYALGVPDGLGGVDNAFGGLIQVIRNQIGNFSSDNYSNSIKAGKSNVILHLKDWNGEANDDQVTLSTMSAAPFDSFTGDGKPPEWKGSDAWPIASDAVNGDVDHPKFVDVNAWVANYQVVATLAEANLRVDVGLTSAQFVNLDMKLTAAFVVCDITPDTTGSWGYTFKKCTLGGRWAANDFVKQLGQFPDPLNNNKPLCAGTDQYRTFRQGICSQVDIYHTVNSPNQLCDSLTLGITYSMKPALLGNVFNLKPIADRCCVPPSCLPGSGEDYAINPKYDCCESIDAADGGQYQACGFPSPPAIVPPISPPVLPDAGGQRPDSGPD